MVGTVIHIHGSFSSNCLVTALKIEEISFFVYNSVSSLRFFSIIYSNSSTISIFTRTLQPFSNNSNFLKELFNEIHYLQQLPNNFQLFQQRFTNFHFFQELSNNFHFQLLSTNLQFFIISNDWNSNTVPNLQNKYPEISIFS